MTASIRRSELQPAVILHRREYRETSLLLEIFSREDGRLPLVARGARRPRRGAALDLQLFQPLLLAWSQRGELGTLHSAEAAGDDAGMLQGDALAIAFYANELLMRLLHRFDPHPRLYDSYLVLLTRIVDSHGREAALRVFEKRLLEETGYGLVLDHDTASGEPLRSELRYVYLPERGPEVCAADAPSRRLPVVHGRTLLALAAEWLPDEDLLREAKALMRSVVDHHLGGRPLSSRALFRQRR